MSPASAEAVDVAGRSDGGGRNAGRPERDPVLDLVRAGALVVVVAWHWGFTTLRWDEGPRVGNPIGETPGLWLATWVLQVMPLFFLIGGALHSAALDRLITQHRAATSGAATGTSGSVARTFVSARYRRLVRPVVPLLALAATAAVAAAALGRPDVVRGIVLMITPLWFLAVYLVLVLVAPLARRLHDRYGLWTVACGVALVAVVDRALVLPSRGDVGLVATLAVYALTWSVVHQLGFHLGALRHAPRRAGWATCLGGFAALGAAATWGGYPASMVGTHPDPISNMSPPNLAVVLLAVAQMGLLVVADRPLRAWCSGRRRLLATAGAWSMTVYVWHMLALAAFWGLLVVAVGAPDHTVDGSWWVQRPLWLIGPTVVAVPLFALTGPGAGTRRHALRAAWRRWSATG